MKVGIFRPPSPFVSPISSPRIRKIINSVSLSFFCFCFSSFGPPPNGRASCENAPAGAQDSDQSWINRCKIVNTIRRGRHEQTPHSSHGDQSAPPARKKGYVERHQAPVYFHACPSPATLRHARAHNKPIKHCIVHSKATSLQLFSSTNSTLIVLTTFSLQYTATRQVSRIAGRH